MPESDVALSCGLRCASSTSSAAWATPARRGGPKTAARMDRVRWRRAGNDAGNMAILSMGAFVKANVNANRSHYDRFRHIRLGRSPSTRFAPSNGLHAHRTSHRPVLLLAYLLLLTLLGKALVDRLELLVRCLDGRHQPLHGVGMGPGRAGVVDIATEILEHADVRVGQACLVVLAQFQVSHGGKPL